MNLQIIDKQNLQYVVYCYSLISCVQPFFLSLYNKKITSKKRFCRSIAIFPKGVVDHMKKNPKVNEFDASLFTCNVVHKAVQNFVDCQCTNVYMYHKINFEIVTQIWQIYALKWMNPNCCDENAFFKQNLFDVNTRS